MPVMNFRTVNVENLQKECKKTTKMWHFCSLRFQSLASTQI